MGKITISEFGNKVIQNLKRYYKTIISISIAIVVPWILTLIFIGFLKLTHGLSEELAEDPMLLSRITIFYTLNLAYEMPILGFGYSLCMIVWAVVGFFIGLYTRDMGKSLISALIGIFVTFFLYFPFVYFVGISMYRDITIHPLIFTRLYEDYTFETPYLLFYQISFHSFALPVLIMFTLLGSMLNSPREVKAPPTDVVPKKVKPKVIAEAEVKANPGEIVEKPVVLEPVAVPEVKTKEKRELRGFPGVVYKQFSPLNKNEQFKEEFKKTFLKILLNPIDELTAALLIFDKGTVDVEEIKKFDYLMKMDKKIIGFDALLQTTTEMLFDLSAGKVSTAQLLKTAIKDKDIKVKGKLKLLKLKKAVILQAKS